MLCPIDVVDGYLITKELRQKLFGRVAGGCGSRNPEDYQRKKIIEGTGYSCRLNDTPNITLRYFETIQNIRRIRCIKLPPILLPLIH